jgi:hypothetical protein
MYGSGFMGRVLADRVPGRPDQAELHEAVDQRPVVPLGGDPAAGDLEHDHAGDVGGASGRWQRLCLGAE